ncbi:MAG: transposase [Planctomycetaceae bacterium]|nr:transposase [Planctomycetaceae bacterium]MBV8383858.1 transposase [Planctomycetaceae bacterium]MBV8606142.1 transposase [Singulisphaera sp.]
MILPDEALPILQAIAPAFTRPTFTRFALLMGAALLCTGRRTVANLLRVAAPLATGHVTSYQRVFSSASWSAMRLACGLCRLVVALLPPDKPLLLAGDDTVDGHPGKKVYGKARHRDPVRSSHGYTAWRYGHKWVVLAVLVRFPFATRPWALPVLVALYRSEEDNRARRRPHRTPAQIMCQLLRVMRLWFPERRLIVVGDAGYGTHEVARFCDRHRLGLTLVSKLHPDANLFEPPPPYHGKGRPRVKGATLPKPRQAAAAARRLRRRTVAWYGGGSRRVGLLSRTGHWYKSGAGLVPIRWVFVRDRDGTHRDEFFFSTDPTLDPVAIIEIYTARWNLETTFQELRALLGLETTRGWSRKTVLRMAPCLFGLYTAVALLYQALPEAKREGGVNWPGKSGVTFSDALMAVRRWLWREWIFPQTGVDAVVQKLPGPVQDLLLYGLAPAA